MHPEEQRYIQEAFEANWITTAGHNIRSFEREIAAFLGIGGAAALSSGTAALHLAVKLAGVQPGDVVLCSDLTFVAAANAIAYEGGKPVFVDSEYETWNIDPRALARGLAKYPRTKAVIVTHLYGTPAKMDALRALCAGQGIPLIEDAAESLGSVYRGRQTGTLGTYGVLSFNGNKIITTSGGGMLLSDDPEAVRRCIHWATQAKEPERVYQHTETGYNYRMSNVLAGIGRGQLLHLEEHIARKRAIYQAYCCGLAGVPQISMHPVPDGCSPNHWIYSLVLSPSCRVRPIDIVQALERENIEGRLMWKPMHLQPLFDGCDLVQETSGRPVSEDLFQRGVCLPSDIKNSEQDMGRILRIIQNLF